MNFIKKIFDNEIDNLVHSHFQKFSKGEFRNRALIEIKKSGNKYSIKTSAEFANEIVKFLAEKLGEEKTMVTGAIISTSNLKGELEFKNVKQFQGVKKYLIESEMSGKDILKLSEKFPKAFFALTFSLPNGDILKIKPKAPTSGKPKNSEEEKPKVDFCSLKTTDEQIVKSFLFEKQDFKEASVNHTYFINSLEIPKELKDSKDFAKIREEALRVGKIVREAVIDGKEERREKEFKA